MRARCLLPVFLLALGGCVQYPEPYRPPVQRRPVEISPATRLRHYISMGMPEAADQILSGVLMLADDKQAHWALKSSAYQFQIPATEGVKFKADLMVPEITFQQTGPVKITVLIDRHALGVIDVARPGQKVVEIPVPPEWLSTERVIVVRLELDKIWKSPADGAERGFLLVSLGFIQ